MSSLPRTTAPACAIAVSVPTYDTALRLLEVLARQGVEANIATGGVQARPTSAQQMRALSRACKDLDLHASQTGYTLLEEVILYPFSAEEISGKSE